MAVDIEITFISHSFIGGSSLACALEQATEALDGAIRVLSVELLVADEDGLLTAL
jgi:hypothetical protein